MLRAFTDWLRTTRWAPRIIGFMLNAGATEEWLVFNTGELYRGQYGPVDARLMPDAGGLPLGYRLPSCIKSGPRCLSGCWRRELDIEIGSAI